MNNTINGYRIYTIWRSGFVVRWHTHPHPALRNAGDETGGHTWRVMVLYTLLCSGREEKTREGFMRGLMYAMFHDCGELITGDVRGPFKNNSPKVAKECEAADTAFLIDHGIPVFPDDPLVSLCDKIDAFLFMLHNAPDLRNNVDWRKMEDGIMSTAKLHKCEDQVAGMFAACEQRRTWF